MAGESKSKPVGMRLTRQDTRNQTEMRALVVTANAPVPKSDPVKEATIVKRRETEVANDFDKQEFRKKVFKQQGSLRCLIE